MNRNSQHIPTEYIGVIFIPRMNVYTGVIEDTFSDIKISGGFYETAYEAARMRAFMLLQLPAHVRARIPSNFIPRADDAEARAVLENPALMPKEVPRISIPLQSFNTPAHGSSSSAVVPKMLKRYQPLKGSTSIADAVSMAAAATAAVADPFAPFGSPNYLAWIRELDSNYEQSTQPYAATFANPSHMTEEEAAEFFAQNNNTGPIEPLPPFAKSRRRRGRRHRTRRTRRTSKYF